VTTYPLRVIARRQETLDAVSLCLEVPANVRSRFAYRPGQFVVVRALIDEATLLRHYSMSSAPELDPHLRITVKKVPQGIVSS
jgi:3-ketosteroid 9alpha-monooxygenase subunit B